MVTSQMQAIFVQFSFHRSENLVKRKLDNIWRKTDKKSRQNAENKQTFGLTGKIERNEKSRQNIENKLLI